MFILLVKAHDIKYILFVNYPQNNVTKFVYGEEKENQIMPSNCKILKLQKF